MHYDVDYSTYDNPLAKHAQALADCREFLGEEKFYRIVRDFRAMDAQPTLEQFTIWLSLAGIQGYPVKAMYNYTFPL